MEKPYITAIVPAAGSASRMGGLDKQFEELDGVPVLARTLAALAGSDWIDEIVVVTRRENVMLVFDLIHAYAIGKIHSVVAGGDTRQQSVQKGLEAVHEQTRYVVIHDGARPLISGQVIADTVLDAMHYGAAAAAVPVKDTIKLAKERLVERTPPRDCLFAVQTPQVFELEAYREAVCMAKDAGKDFTDDCQLMEFAGKPVYLSKGDDRNLKITTPLDLMIARFLLMHGEVME